MAFLAEYDPSRDPLWSDPEVRAAYLADLANGFDPDAVDESDYLVEPGLSVDEGQAAFDHFLDIEQTVRSARALATEQDHLFQLTLARAAAEPDFWVGPDPTADPAWEDPRGRSVSAVRADRCGLAVRAAAADLGARVQLSDNQVRLRAHRAEVLATRTPRLWAECLQGFVSEQNAAAAAQLAGSLPDDDPDSWSAFDDAIHDAATRLAPGRFKIRARAARERAHSESLQERHHRAAKDRRVCVDADLDGMAWVGAYLPAADARAIDRSLDDSARHLATAEGETRSLAQLRADTFVDLLTQQPSGDGSHIAATVNITIPVLTLLGQSDEPATLDGYGPIDLDTAKKLAGGATSWTRVLTHPITSTVLDVDRRAYKVPADLRRWLGIHYPTCIFPGCTRSADRCDVDHRQRWADGGTTSADNTAPECASHHPVKDESRWTLRRDPDTGRLTWRTPSGFETDVDPPPF